MLYSKNQQPEKTASASQRSVFYFIFSQQVAQGVETKAVSHFKIQCPPLAEQPLLSVISGPLPASLLNSSYKFPSLPSLCGQQGLSHTNPLSPVFLLSHLLDDIQVGSLKMYPCRFLSTKISTNVSWQVPLLPPIMRTSSDGQKIGETQRCC